MARQLTEIDQSLSLHRLSTLINQFNAARLGGVADRHLRVVVGQALRV